MIPPARRALPFTPALLGGGSCLQSCRPLPGLSPLRASHAGSRCWIPVQDKSRGRLEAQGPAEGGGCRAGLHSCHRAEQPPLPALPELLLRCPHPLPRHPAPSSSQTSLSQFFAVSQGLFVLCPAPPGSPRRADKADGVRHLGVRVPAVGTPLLRGTGGAQGTAQELPQAIPARSRYGTRRRSPGSAETNSSAQS